MKDRVLTGFGKRKKRDLFWRGYLQAKAKGKETSHMLHYAEILLGKKERAVQMLYSLFE